MLDLRKELESMPSGRGRPPFPGHEYVRGWGVFGLPLDSGHVLALRVFPENSFAPYRTVWHRDPEGRWAIHPKRMYWVAASGALLNGDDLGAPTRLADCPTISGVTLPARGVLAVGEAAWEPSHAGMRETLGLA